MWFQFQLFVIWLLLKISDVNGISSYYMDINCGKVISTEKSGSSAFQLSLTQNAEYSRGFDCQLVVQARPGHKLMFYFASFDIKFYSYIQLGRKYSGCIDYIVLSDGALSSSPFIKGFTAGICGISRAADDTIYNSTGQYVTIGFHSRSSTTDRWATGNAGFTLVFTEFHTGTCSSNEFRCPNNRRCIKQSDTCKNHNPCGDHTDCMRLPDTYHPSTNTYSSETQTGLDVPTVIGIVVSVGFIIILLVLVVAVIKSRRFSSRARRCRRRNNISFIDVDNTTAGQPPSYEEVCGVDGPYGAMPPPPYMEEDPNKTCETPADGETQSNTSRATDEAASG